MRMSQLCLKLRNQVYVSTLLGLWHLCLPHPPAGGCLCPWSPPLRTLPNVPPLPALGAADSLWTTYRALVARGLDCGLHVSAPGRQSSVFTFTAVLLRAKTVLGA